MIYPVHPAAEMFPILPAAELQELADDIRKQGLLEPIWLYDDPERGTVLLDGRNRLTACGLADVQPRYQVYTGVDPIAFSIAQNLTRRHLTAGQKGFVALEVEKLYAAEANKGGRPNQLPTSEQPNKPSADLRQVPVRDRRSDEKAAKVVGTSGRVVNQAKRVAEKAPDLAERVKAGALPIDRADRIVRDREAEQKRVEQAQADVLALEEQPLVDIRCGDFREVLAECRNVDAIITDPPYPAEYLHLLDDLAALADKVLAPEGVLVILFGQTHLPEVYRRLDGHRPYRWTGCYLTPGAAYVSQARRVQSNWKPLLVYGGGPRFADTLQTVGSDAQAKDLHKWGQDYNAFHTLIERFTRPGQTVCDPFMGSGTTLLAAKALGRHCVGAEIDPDAYRTAEERLK